MFQWQEHRTAFVALTCSGQSETTAVSKDRAPTFELRRQTEAGQVVGPVGSGAGAVPSLLQRGSLGCRHALGLHTPAAADSFAVVHDSLMMLATIKTYYQVFAIHGDVRCDIR